MNRTMDRRLATIEAKRAATDLSDLTDAELEARIAEIDAELLKYGTPDELRAQMLAMGCSQELLSFLASQQRETAYAHG